MMRPGIVLSIWVLGLCLCSVSSQPAGCTEKDQCSEGLYCDTELFICKRCLSCKDLKREQLPTHDDCITSVSHCGACFKGLVVDPLGDVNAPCVLSGSEESVGTPHYVWWLIGVVLLGLALIVGIIVYICMNPGIFEKFAGNCDSGTVSTNLWASRTPHASAPEAPPPYSPVRTTDSPCPTMHEPTNAHLGEEGLLFKQPFPSWPQGGRESADNQAARPYNRPIYDRHDLPPSPESPIEMEGNENAAIHDDETEPSPWTPAATNGDINDNVNDSGTVSGNGDVNVPSLLAAARDTSLFEHTPPKQMCLPTSLNRNRDSNSNDSNGGTFSSSQNGAPPYNFITQITNVVQINRNS